MAEPSWLKCNSLAIAWILESFLFFKTLFFLLPPNEVKDIPENEDNVSQELIIFFSTVWLVEEIEHTEVNVAAMLHKRPAA